MILMTRFTRASFFVAFVCAFAVAAPAAAQEGSRYRVLVPNLEPQQQAGAGFGEDVAEELRGLIDDMATHEPVGDREVRDALRRFRIDEDDLDCVRARQLAVQLGAELVMCGSYQPAADRHNTVTASFVAARTGERFEVQPFQANRDRDAARHIFNAFNSYVEQVRQTTFCLDYLASQQYQTALETCEVALAANPASTTALYAVSRARLGIAEEKNDTDIYVRAEDERAALLNQSLQGLQRVLEINPMHQEAIQTAGFVAVKLDQRDLARQYYRQYLDLNPGAASVRVTVANDLATAGDPEGALDLIIEGVELGGDTPDPMLLEYAGHYAMGAAAAAETAAAPQATGGAPEGPSGRSARELYDLAIQYYERVQTARGAETPPTVMRRMVQALAASGRMEDAITLAEQARQTYATDAGVLDMYATTLNSAGRVDEAINALQQLAQVDTSARVLARQGVWLTRAGRFSDARAAFERAIESGETTGDEASEAIFAVGYNQFYRAGQHGPAMAAFEASRELATSDVKRSRASFWMGYSLYQRAEATERAATPTSARAALPLFRSARTHFQNGGAYAATESSINIGQMLSAVDAYIQRQETIIERGTR